MSTWARSNRRTAVTAAPALGVAMVAVGAALWGVDTIFREPLISRGGASWQSWTIVMCEHLILTTVCLPLLLTRRRQIPLLDRMGWLSVVVVAWGGSALATLAFTDALTNIPLGQIDSVVLLQKTQPLWAIATSAIVLGERPRPQLAFFLIPAAFGSYLLAFGTASPGEAFSSPAGRSALLALVAAALWGSATAFGRRAMRSISFELLTTLRFTIALPLLIVLAATHGALTPPASAHTEDYLRILVIALVPGLAAMLLYYRGLRETPASVATFAELAWPASAVVLNYVFLGATISRPELVGAIILWVTIAQLHRLPVGVTRRPQAEPSAA
jgi:drug/metabolite transporter (DMT)-like permease